MHHSHFILLSTQIILSTNTGVRCGEFGTHFLIKDFHMKNNWLVLLWQKQNRQNIKQVNKKPKVFDKWQNFSLTSLLLSLLSQVINIENLIKYMKIQILIVLDSIPLQFKRNKLF